jgi:2-polyprenyl-6-hydroxyphenyl methylase/3-demethylubiquinone-9 3-methyltransferase
VKNSADKPANSVQFHDDLSKDWEFKYRRSSYRNRLGSFFALLGGNDLNGQRWLDAGCGTGVLARALAERGCSVIGVDASPGMIEVAKSSLSARGHVSSGNPVFEVIETIERLDFEGADFDGVVCSSVLEYVNEPDKAIGQFHRILKPGGVLLVSVPNKKSLLRNTQKLLYRAGKSFFGTSRPAYLAYSRHAYTSESFSRLLAGNGFIVTSSVGFGPYMPRVVSGMQFASSIIIFLAKKHGFSSH